ncbi:MAG: TonB-dependent receptor [Bacteroidota bacterium]
MPLARLVLLLALLGAPSVVAQPLPQAALPDSVVVTATRGPISAQQTGRVVQVVTAAEIAALPVRSVDELVRFVGGAETQTRGGFGAQSDFTLRGATFGGTLLLIDGVRFNDPMTGHFLSDLPLPLAEIARVEVLRGPAAAVYGPDALGGVIHLLTHTGLGDRTDAQSASGTFSDDATRFLELGARTATERSTFSLAVDDARTDGDAVLAADGTAIVGSDGPVRTDLDRRAVSAAMHLDLGEATTLYARLGGDRRDFGATQFYTPFASDTAREATSTTWAHVRLQRTGRTSWTAHLAGRLHSDTYAFFPGLSPNEHDTYRSLVSVYASRDLMPALRLTAGANADLRGIESNNQGDHRDGAAGVFAQALWLAAPTITLTAAARLDYDAGFGWEPTPSLSAAWTPTPLVTVRGAVARAVRAPSYVERYFNTLSPRPDGNLGNPDLRAERAWNAEAGVDVTPVPGLALRATGFWRRTDDLIDFAKLTPDATFFLAQNVLAVTTLGLDLDAEVRRPLRSDLGAGFVTGAVGYTLLDAALDGEVEGATYKYALTNARHHVRGQLALRLGGASLGVQALWKERLDGETYAVAHLKGGYDWRLPLAVEGLRLGVFAEVHNVFDERYAEVFGAPMPRRRLLGGLRLGLGV